jgi:rhodanese-related sulfurtransferase
MRGQSFVDIFVDHGHRLSNNEQSSGRIIMQQFTNINADGLRRYMNEHHERDYVLVDVRQGKEYVEGHIAGANLVPLAELSARMIELPDDRDIIFY